MNILVISIGGTISQKTVNGKMAIDLRETEFSKVAPDDVNLDYIEFSKTTGVNLGILDLFRLQKKILGLLDDYQGFLLLTGTDSLEEIAFGLDLLIDINKPFVITGAMRPKDALGYDGYRNFRDAIEVIRNDHVAKSGVLVVISEDIHAARYLRKLDSQAMSAFESRPGPIGKLRRGKPQFYYLGMPKIKKYEHISDSDLKVNVPIIPIYLGCKLKAEEFFNFDALILAGMGTGSLPDNVIASLSPALTEKIPVCITTRCPIGDNYDDFHYKGSLEKYTSKGFLLEGFEGLSPYQARLKLIFEMAENTPQP